MTRVTMLLARGPDQPNGDVTDRLVLGLALTPQGQIDVDAYYAAPTPWLAFRTEGAGEKRPLEVIRIDDGWALQSTNSEDDPIWVFDGHVFRPGELVSLRRPDSQILLYRIVATEAAPLHNGAG